MFKSKEFNLSLGVLTGVLVILKGKVLFGFQTYLSLILLKKSLGEKLGDVL